MPKKTQIAGRCVFCGGLGLNREHIWSDWLTKRGAVPAHTTHTNTNLLVKFDNFSNTAFVRPKFPRNHQGSLVQRKLRVVCEGCNGGWMKGIVDTALPFAEPMIRGEPVSLDELAQIKVSSWIALSCIMAEFLDRDTMAIPDFDRKFIKDNLEPPSDWRIFVSRYLGGAWGPTSYQHIGTKFAVLSAGQIGTESDKLHDCQVSTYVLNGLAIHAASSTHPLAMDMFIAGFAPKEMDQIWPPSEMLHWPTKKAVGDFDLNIIHSQFMKHLAATRRRA